MDFGSARNPPSKVAKRGSADILVVLIPDGSSRGCFKFISNQQSINQLVRPSVASVRPSWSPDLAARDEESAAGVGRQPGPPSHRGPATAIICQCLINRILNELREEDLLVLAMWERTQTY